MHALQAPNGSLFPAAIFTLYCTYLAYSALVSEPHSYECNSLGHKLNAASASTLATGMGLALLSVVYSALRAGSNTALFNLAQSVGAADEVRAALCRMHLLGPAFALHVWGPIALGAC